MEPQLLTVSDVAARCGVTRQTLMRWLRKGECPQPTKPGVKPRWSSAVIENWLNPNPKEQTHERD